MSAAAEVPELERFRVLVKALLLDDGWSADPEGPAGEGIFYGSFVKAIAVDFVATATFILESGPSPSSLFGRRQLRALIGGEIGVRHLPTAARLRQLPVRMGTDTNISRDITDALTERGRTLPVITDGASAERAARELYDAVRQIGEPFAHDHADLDAMIRFVQTGQQVDRDELFQAIFVPVGLLSAGRTADAHDALTQYAETLEHESDRRQYAEVVRTLRG